jgi:hypothetical protein
VEPASDNSGDPDTVMCGRCLYEYVLLYKILSHMSCYIVSYILYCQSVHKCVIFLTRKDLHLHDIIVLTKLVSALLYQTVLRTF